MKNKDFSGDSIRKIRFGSEYKNTPSDPPLKVQSPVKPVVSFLWERAPTVIYVFVEIINQTMDYRYFDKRNKLMKILPT